ncbi:MAG: ABC transporter permease [Acidimicrobiia bacterium]|nr:ABC transporter permease [Acidimicrobiia bacterium]
MTVLLIAANSLRRLVRQRANLFFVFVLPLLLILVLGSTAAGFEPRIGVVTGVEPTPLGAAFADQLEAGGGVEVTTFADEAEARDLLQREELSAVVILPEGYGETFAGGPTAVEYLALPDGNGFEQQGLVDAVVADQNAKLRAARLVASEAGIDLDAGLATVAEVEQGVPRTAVLTVDADGEDFAGSDEFGQVAGQQLVLFLFLIGMIASAAIIQSRRLGVTRRMLATPASTGQVLGGILLGRFGVAVVQGVFIAVATSLVFGADWGSWPAALAVIGVFSLVATAAAVLVGSMLHNENQSTAVGMSVGLAFAAFGGCMVPLEVFPDGLRRAAHVTPHAWANDAFAEVVQRGGGIVDVTTELAVLLVYAAGLLGLATVMLRRSLQLS